METNRKLDFEDDPFGNTKKAQEEKATLEMAKEKQAFNQVRTFKAKEKLSL